MENFVDHLECPSVEGIIFPNGIIQMFDVKINRGSPTIYKIKMKSKTSIDELQIKGNLEWNSCAIIDRLKDTKNNIEVISGECDYGSEGFLAVVNLNTEKLIWLAFFHNSNPFSHLKMDGKIICAMGTYNCFWKFNLENPTSFSVECI